MSRSISRHCASVTSLGYLFVLIPTTYGNHPLWDRLLVDNPDFKGRLFQTYPNAIGGEMEGVGVAASAEREKCEWILVKAICDWADGEKTDQHQGFAAASAVSFVQHLLSQSGVI
jgi:nucleoside phosphorylase